MTPVSDVKVPLSFPSIYGPSTTLSIKLPDLTTSPILGLVLDPSVDKENLIR